MRVLPAVALLVACADAALLAAWLQRDDTTPAPVPATPVVAPARTEVAASETASADVPHAAREPVAAPASEAASSPTGDARAVLFGSVAHADGSEVGRGWVTVEREDVQRSAGLQGPAYAVAGLQPGMWTLRASIRDELPVDATIDVRAPRTRFDLVLPAATRLPVYAVTPSGEPLLEALAKADRTAQQLGAWSVLALPQPLTGELPLTSVGGVAQGIGGFRSAVGWPGGIGRASAIGMLVVPRGTTATAMLLLRNTVIAQAPIAANATEITFTIDVASAFARLATIRVRIVDEDGAPWPQARLVFDRGRTATGSGSIDANGVLTCRVPPGLLDVDALPMFAPLGRLAATTGATIDLGDIVVPRGTPNVRFEFATEPPVDATVVLCDLEPPHGSRWRARVEQARIVDGRGDTRLPQRRHSLFVASTTHAALVEVDGRATLPRPFVVPLSPATRVLIEWRVELGITHVEIRAANGGIVLDREFSGNGSRTVVLPRGTYAVTMDGMNGTTQRQLTVGSEAVTLRIE